MSSSKHLQGCAIAKKVEEHCSSQPTLFETFWQVS